MTSHQISISNINSGFLRLSSVPWLWLGPRLGWFGSFDLNLHSEQPLLPSTHCLVFTIIPCDCFPWLQLLFLQCCTGVCKIIRKVQHMIIVRNKIAESATVLVYWGTTQDFGVPNIAQPSFEFEYVYFYLLKWWKLSKKVITEMNWKYQDFSLEGVIMHW